MSLETARRVLRIEAAAIEDLAQAPRRNFRPRRGFAFHLQGTRRRHRHGQVRINRPQNCRHIFQYGHAFVFSASRRSACTVIWECSRAMTSSSRFPTAAKPKKSSRFCPRCKRLEVAILTLTGQPRSSLAAASAVVLDVSVKEEACSLNLAPTASTTAALAMGDALAVSLLDRRGFDTADFAALHPSGRLGKKLMRVEALMHAGDAMPRVAPGAKMPDIIYEMSKKGLGMTTVVDE